MMNEATPTTRRGRYAIILINENEKGGISMYSNNKVNGFFTRTLRLAVFVLVTTLALTGCDDDSIVAPESTNEDPAAQIDLTVEERVLLDERGISVDAAGAAISRAAVQTFADPSGATVGTSLLVRDADGVAALLRFTDLTPEEAVTMWLVIFNAPENCSDNVCNEDDLANTDARVDIVYGDGKVIRDASKNASWRDSYYFAYRQEGVTGGSIVPVVFGAPALGLEDARKAEVHLVLRTHGPVIPELEQEMISTFAGGCEGFPEALGKAGPNTCTDIQFSVHQPVN